MKNEIFQFFEQRAPVLGDSSSESKIPLDLMKPSPRSDSGQTNNWEKSAKFDLKSVLFSLKLIILKFRKLLHQATVNVHQETKNRRNRSNQLWEMAFHIRICEKIKVKIKRPSNFPKFKFWYSDKMCTCPGPYSIGFCK